MHLFETTFVWFLVDKMQGIGGMKALVIFPKFPPVKQLFEPFLGRYLEMEITGRTNVKIRLQILLPDDLLAPFALDPQTFRAHGAISQLNNRCLLFFKPSHVGLFLYSEKAQIVS